MSNHAIKLLDEVSPEAADTALDQGWDEHSIIIHLLGLMKDEVPQLSDKLSSYFSTVAEEENDASASLGDFTR
ncbi:hypothetical protein [Sulfitobacter sp. R18_1]|uniref:hypothetical protein n=1 Tax=Sulfitobacter sp. R18_1 TaxID=2821104 RepID=UPI001ADCC6B4|nr:hypothetical protein [Sulfitobacter sp. R18_1]MBO9428350.1 hypothetical protein [Sulfitobacter sp. R18_1]